MARGSIQSRLRRCGGGWDSLLAVSTTLLKHLCAMSSHMSRRESLAERAVRTEIVISADKAVDARIGGSNALFAGIAVKLKGGHRNDGGRKEAIRIRILIRRAVVRFCSRRRASSGILL